MEKNPISGPIRCLTALLLCTVLLLLPTVCYPKANTSASLDNALSELINGSTEPIVLARSGATSPFIIQVSPVRHVRERGEASADFTASITSAINDSLQLAVTGTVVARSRARKIVTIYSIGGTFAKKQLSLQQPFSVIRTSQRWEVNRLALTVDDGTLLISGSQEGENLDLSIALEQFPVALFAPIGAPAIEGVLDGEGSLTGTLSAPSITGTCSLRGGRYEHPVTGTILQAISGVLKGQGTIVDLSDIVATEPSGGVTQGFGSVQLLPEHNFPFALSLNVEDATLYRTSTIEASFTGPLTIAGTTKQATISGSLAVPVARIRIPPPLPREGISLPATEIGTGYADESYSEQTRCESEGFLTTAIELYSHDGIHIQGGGLQSRWQGSVSLSGPLSKQALKAKLTLVDGSFVLFGNHAPLVEGIMVFDGCPSALTDDARLAVLAERKGKQSTARLHIAGKMSSAAMFIESSTIDSYNELLSYTLFGRSLPSITPAQAILLGRARNVLATQSINIPDFVHRVKRSLHVERLDLLQPDPRPREIDPTARGYIHEDVYVEVEEDPGGQPGQVTVEIELTPNIYLETEAGSDEEGGIGLIYKWRY